MYSTCIRLDTRLAEFNIAGECQLQPTFFNFQMVKVIFHTPLGTVAASGASLLLIKTQLLNYTYSTNSS